MDIIFLYLLKSIALTTVEVRYLFDAKVTQAITLGIQQPMAKFLNTQEISTELMKLIKDAKDKIILVSYSFQVNPQIKERIKTTSKRGTLSEIVFVIGDTKFEEPDKEWMLEIQDLKVIQKPNLHAKCYLNEERAIIGSMNLYDYSQQNNIEMGILITKANDLQAYEELIEEINNIKINGQRVPVKDLQTKASRASTLADNPIKSKPKDIAAAVNIKLTDSQKLLVRLLQEYRYQKSKEEKTSATQILSDEEIRRIAVNNGIDKKSIYDVIEKKNAIRYGDEIIALLNVAPQFTIGKVTGTFYQVEESKYDRVKLLANGDEKWFDTTQELPQKNRMVAVKLNKSWFNAYFYLDD